MSKMQRNPGDYSLLARIFLRDLAFLNRLYRRTNDRTLWSYAVISVSVTLGSLLFFVCAAVLVLFTDFVPASVHPASASEEVFIAEFVTVYLIAWLTVEFTMRSLRGRENVAAHFRAPSDTAKWWLTTLITVASVAAAMFLLSKAVI